MQYYTRIMFLLIFSTFHFNTFSQASGSADFEIRVRFEESIPASALKVSYFKKAGNRFNTIHYKIDPAKNELIISGNNHYILWIPFPTLVFNLVEYEVNESGAMKECNTAFYLGTNGSLSTYDKLTLDKELYFSKKEPNLVVIQENRLMNPIVKRARLGNYSNESIDISNESVRIFPAEH